MIALPLVDASAQENDEEAESAIESIVVTATRLGNLVADEPTRIEVLPGVEIEENLTVQPGNLSTLLTEFGGLYTQASGGLNGASLSMRGLPGRHTLVLQDGLPLLGTQTDSFGLLQVPPLDLARVEVIKGANSALYGGTALGGTLNLVSRRPDTKSEMLFNRTSHEGTDGVAFLAHAVKPSLGYTVTAGVHDQEREDIDGDAWADLAGYRRYTVRPRLFWENDAGRSIFATVGYSDEDRNGGSMPGQTLFDGTTFREALNTSRVDAGMVAEIELSQDRRWSARWSATRTDHERGFSDDLVQDTATTALMESTLSGTSDDRQWLLGVAVQYDELESIDAPDADYSYVVPGIFGQGQYELSDTVTLAASGRVDAHSDYGTFFSPRLSALFRPAGNWTVRASIGGGFAAPTPRMDETEATSLARLLPWDDVDAERAVNTSLDLKWAANGFEVNVSLFGSEIRDPLTMEDSAALPGRIQLTNAEGPLRAVGTELLVHYVAGFVHFIGSATYLDATEAAPAGGRRESELLPRTAGELALLFEKEDRGRFGIELSYTGEQQLLGNPYRAASESYIELSALASIEVGRASIFLNAINLTDERQTDYDPLLLPTPAPDGQRIVDRWASLAGRTLNLGVRVEL